MEALLTKIQQSEGQTTEFKTPFQKEVIKIIIAFANAIGSKVLIGITDSAEIIGTTVSAESIQKYINTIKQNTQPNIIIDINEEIIDGSR